MFNLELYKKNKKSIFIALIIIVGLTFINVYIEGSKIVKIKLNRSGNNINKLVINEIMTSNKGALIDSSGNNYDWIELYNGYDYDINLEDYGLSDEENGKIKWGFPDVTIKSKSYLIVFLSGKYEEGLVANFSLRQEGDELITLKDTKQKVIDTVRTEDLEKNTAMARDINGKWITTEEITPGFENTEEGRKKFLKKLQTLDETKKLTLTEFLPANEGNIVFDNNKLYSYVEVTNYSNEIINLGDYYLSNDSKIIYKWRFPNVDLKPNDTYIIYMNKLNKNNNASFDLDHKTGTVILSSYKGILEQVDYDELTNGVGYIKRNEKWYENSDLSPGYLNNQQGKDLFNKNIDMPKSDLIINEVMSLNSKFLSQNGNQFYDWIELYNNSNEIINLKEYSITNDSDYKDMYRLPDIVLQPNSYFILMASGDTALSNTLYTHLNFKLSSGNGVFLYKNNKLIDSIYIYNIPKGSSYGRGEVSGHYYYDNPTPGSKNINGVSEISYNPIFSVKGGVYNDVESLTLKIEGSGEIYYTLDGSEPTKKSNKYILPIELKNTVVVRAVSYENGKKNSDIVTNSYIINEKHSIPVMSISMNQSSFNQVQSSGYGKSMVRANAELYEKNSSFNIVCDFKLFGGESRTYAKKSFALKFNYGHLKYKVFDERNILEFNTLVLRSGSQDQTKAMMRDEFTSSIASKYGTLDTQAYKPIVLYINGKYWGVYYIREKIEDDFIEKKYNVLSKTNIINNTYNAEEGNNNDIIKLRNYINSNDMRNNANYEYVSSLLDIENYIDYWVYQFILNNTDIHNVRYYNNYNVSNNKIRMILYDLDYTLNSNSGSYYLDFMQHPIGLMGPIDNSILSGLMKNETFRKKFVERTAYYLNNVWNSENINKEFDLIYNAIKPEMERNCKRWNISYNNWNNMANAMKNTALNRSGIIKSSIKSYFNLSEGEFNEYFNK